MNPDFVGLLRALSEAEARYLIVGAYAVTFHSRPRATAALERRIDLLTSITGVTFDEAWPSRVSGAFGEIEVPFIGRAELARNKRALGRRQDLADLELTGRDLRRCLPRDELERVIARASASLGSGVVNER